jgi:hypothetical protein
MTELGGGFSSQVWREIPLSDATRLEQGMAVTGIGSFRDLDTVQALALATIRNSVAEFPGYTSWYGTPTVDITPGLSAKWRPRQFNGRILDGVVYVSPLDEQFADEIAVADKYGDARPHSDAAVNQMFLPIMFAGGLSSRGKALTGFLGRGLYYPVVLSSYYGPVVGNLIRRILMKPEAQSEIDAIVQKSHLESRRIGHELIVWAMQRPYSGGSMGGGKRR